MEQAQPQTQAPKGIDPNKWRPGTYRAKAIDWGVGATKENLPQVMVLFAYQQPSIEKPGTTEDRDLIWFGNFKGGALERTMETLVNLGLRSPVSSMETGVEGKALDAAKEVEIVVEHRSYEGKIRAGISWVNEVGGRMKGKLEVGESKKIFAEIDAMFMAGLAQKGIAAKTSSASTPAQQRMAEPTFNEEDVPF